LNYRKSRVNFEDLDLPAVEDLPAEVDWVSAGAVTPVLNQGQCGSCYSFSALESVESAYFLETGKLVNLSEQQIVDCSSAYGNEGCNGGEMSSVFQYIIDNGICLEKDYPYKAVDGTCKKCKSALKIDSFVDVTPNSETALQQAVSLRPIAIAIEADQSSFQFYSSGVLTSSCGTALDHGVELVGYGTYSNDNGDHVSRGSSSNNGIDYWKVRNSWGKSWGMDGYILLARNVKQKGGQCGIAMQPSYPVFKTEELVY
jgi:C1A family cysteine protease